MDPVDTFLEEAENLFEQLETTLLELDQNPSQEGGVDAAFRALHTLKGSGSMMGFDAMASFAHVLETAFDRVRNGHEAMSRKLVDLALRSVDVLKALLQGQGDTVHAEETALRADLEQASNQNCAAPASSAGAVLVDDATDTFRHFGLEFSPSKEAIERGLEPLTTLEKLRSLGNASITAHLPDLSLHSEAFDETQCCLRWTIQLSGDLTVDSIREVAHALDGDLEVTEVGQIFEDLSEQVEDRGRAAQPAPVEKASSPKKGQNTVKVDITKLDQLLDLVGELVIARSRLTQIAGTVRDPELSTVSEDVERLTEELRDRSMSLRMQPVGLLFRRYNRLVRDLGRQLDKDVMLVTEGDETEVDKTILERLGDSMVHLIRNAVDHGVESKAEREAAKKPTQGTVRLRARHQEGSVFLQVVDDGKGLSKEQIRQKAERKGLIGPEEDLTDERCFNLIFEPGFSTAEKVSSVSGRGVGMDVVRRGIEDLGGDIRIESEPGLGTTFTVQIPLTLAIVDGLLVHLGEDAYVMPLNAVEECIETPTQEEDPSQHKVTEVRGELVPYLSLREWFDIPGSAPEQEQIVIANFTGQRFGFVVDKVVGQHQAVLKKLDPMTRTNGLSGSTILGDGTVALMLDGAAIMKEAEEHHAEQMG